MEAAPFRMPVQLVSRPSSDFRGFAGTIAAGSVRPGDEIRVLPRDTRSTVERIVTYDGDLDEAVAGQAVTLTLADEIDASRGDMIASDEAPPGVADQFEATIVWMADDPMYRGRNYLMRIGSQLATATIAPLKYKLNVNTLEHMAATKLELNEIGVIDLELDRPIAFDPYDENRDTGGFILVDRITNETVGAGMIRFALRRAANLKWQTVDVDKAARAAAKGQQPSVLWFTGLSGAGKSTIANLVETELHRRGCHTYMLDGDNVRHGLNKDLGFTAGRPRRERAPGRRGRAADDRRRPDRARLLHLAVPQRAPDGARADGGGRVPRGVRRHAAGDRRAARPEGALREGAARRAGQLHRHRLALRAARARRAAARHHGAHG